MTSKKTYLMAIAEAERFIEKAKYAVNDIEQYQAEKEAGTAYTFIGNTNSAAAKRASMDLTRALVHIRK